MSWMVGTEIFIVMGACCACAVLPGKASAAATTPAATPRLRNDATPRMLGLPIARWGNFYPPVASPAVAGAQATQRFVIPARGSAIVVDRRYPINARGRWGLVAV